MAGAQISVKNVSRLFKLGSEDVLAVDNVSLEIAAGEFLALVGRSGSGKTTLLNLIAGLDRPTSGEVWIDGQRVDRMSDKQLNELRRHTVSVIFQSFGLLPLLSAHENVELPLRIAGVSARERGRRTRRVLELVGLGRRTDHRPYELSGGEQQRVAIARALATEPRLILADEPTGELDSATAVAVFGLMRDLARSEGITIVTCTHDRLVMERADRVEELSDGRLLEREEQQVWTHVQARERSPFAAQEGDSETTIHRPSGLSSLLGADQRVFTASDEGAPESPKEPKPAEVVAAEVEAEELTDDEADDASRWARPDRSQ
ncbi:MAG: ABC transporter ATP-binding protein [Dehalococcoidia bacterium]|nr:ABC transporter ATP-binding protein [Dehalococcoidia bacterium]